MPEYWDEIVHNAFAAYRLANDVPDLPVWDRANREWLEQLRQEVEREEVKKALEVSLGVQVIVSPLLPTDVPSPGEDARRMVRHGMKDVLTWLGEDVGPRPGERTHALMVGDHTMLASHEVYRGLRGSGTSVRYTPGSVNWWARIHY